MRFNYQMRFGMCVAAVVLFSASAWAAPYRSFHKGVRPLGMGGAFTAVANDQNAINYNPAGLSRTTGVGIGILNPMVEASEDSYELFQDFDEIDQDKTAEVSKLLKKHVGENNHIKAAADVYAGFRVKNAGVMIASVGRVAVDMAIHDSTDPSLEFASVADYGGEFGVGYALQSVPGLSVGVGVKAISRTSLDKTFKAADIASDNFEDTIEDAKKEGTDASIDLGLIWTRDIEGLTQVSLGLAGLNLKEMDFGEARDQKTQFNAGVAFVQTFWGCTLTEALDYQDITDNLVGDDSMEKKLHIGAELKLPWLLAIRGGLSQGYYTAGATVDLKILRIDVATYGEELGVYSGQREDRRYVAQVSVGWSW